MLEVSHFECSGPVPRMLEVPHFECSSPVLWMPNNSAHWMLKSCTLNARDPHSECSSFDFFLLQASFVSFKGINFFHWPENAVLAASSSYIRSFSGEGSKNKPGNVRRRSDLPSRRGLFIGRDWTNILLGVNVLWVSPSQTRTSQLCALYIS